VEDRGAFYDSVGALRDVGQNHLLQMLGLVLMNAPKSFSTNAIRLSRKNVIDTLVVPTRDDVKRDSFRAQYEGYQSIDGVSEGSMVETYFRVKGYLNHPRWRGVPFTIEAGKKIGEVKKEIVVYFKHPSLCMCTPEMSHEYQNKVIFSLEPKEEISMSLWSKIPGYEMKIEKKTFDFPYRGEKSDSQYTQEYEKLLLDCFSGDQTLFVTTAEVSAMWKFIDPIISEWKKDVAPLHKYERDSVEVRSEAKKFFASVEPQTLGKEIGIIGLGKMGSGIAMNLMDHGWSVFGYNRTKSVTKKLEREGLVGVYSIKDFKEVLKPPRVIWVMVPAGKPVDEMITKLSTILDEGDIVIDGGNTYFEDARKHSEMLAKDEIKFVDVGVSGGPEGARSGACLMVGGKRSDYDHLLPLYTDLSVSEGSEHFEGIGAGHFVKMVHNGIEYGMMQAIAEGFDIMKSSEYKLHLSDIAGVYNNGSVIESRLIAWMEEGFELFGDDLKEVSGSAGSGGSAGMKNSEGQWTVDVADKLGISVDNIKSAIDSRIKSQSNPSYQGKIINTLRNQFGGHGVEKSEGTK